MRISEVMNRDIETIAPDARIVDVAQQMAEGDFGVMPVIENNRVVGMVTDRDIVVRGVAKSRSLDQLTVKDVMTAEALTCSEDDDVSAVAKIMGDGQVRRLPVLNKDKKLVYRNPKD